MLLHFNALAIDSWSGLNLPTIDYGFYRPDSQDGKGQYIKDCNLAQVEDAVKMDIKIEWNSDDYD